MTVAEASTDRIEALEAKIDRLSDQMAVLTAEAEAQARQRESFAELRDDLIRVSRDAMVSASTQLDAMAATTDFAAVAQLLGRLVEVAPRLERTLVVLDQVGEFIDDAAPLGTDVMTMLSDRLAVADRKGYFAFARAGTDIFDRVVANFDEADLALLGDNIVVILEAVREITQPELLGFLTRMVDAVRVEQRAVELEAVEPPSLLALARQVRDPDVRRGLARALNTLRAVSVETGPVPPNPRSEGDSE